MKQRTIGKEFSVEGIGLHTGENVRARFLPADANSGIVFRVGRNGEMTELDSNLKYVTRTNRGTTISKNDVSVSTIEHVLSAIVGCDVDNVIIELDGPELPILDGSASEITNKILEVGVNELDVSREVFEIKEQIEFIDEETGSEYLVIPSNNFEILTMIDFDSESLGNQYAELKDLKDYGNEVAPARTFVFLHELEHLIDKGLIKGGSLDNALVFVDRVITENQLSALANKLNVPKIEIDKTGVVNGTKLRFENEPARHKLLDLIGDLALIGTRIKGKIIAKKPGHTSNIRLAKLLKQKWVEQKRLKGKPDYDPDQEALLNIEGIQKLLPHRHPFLLVDKIIELSDQMVVGVKNITFNEPHFQGHFPDNPIFPGVLQMEALAQTGGILALSSQPDPGNWDTYFLKMENVKFKKMVVPGDTLILKMELLAPIRRGIVRMQGTAYVGNNIVSEGELTAQIVNRS